MDVFGNNFLPNFCFKFSHLTPQITLDVRILTEQRSAIFSVYK